MKITEIRHKNTYLGKIGLVYIRKKCTFAPDIARPRLQEWHTYVRTHYPDSRMDSYAYRYQQLPFHVFYYYMRAHVFIERVQRFIKRKLHLK